ncbi:hypothetical protein [Paenibacillus koleovorans]|uniref:hypothetical protein n=1 Tax=Paenibacillus koleovorans TaxID=121608 RepID=UPI000FD7D3EA|nr:hypothetical protein [Paenibacillus koleovorans]
MKLIGNKVKNTVILLLTSLLLAQPLNVIAQGEQPSNGEAPLLQISQPESVSKTDDFPQIGSLSKWKVIEPNIVSEDISKRTANSKYFLMTDGSKKVVLSAENLHYEDERGKWQEIDTTLVDEVDLDRVISPVSKEVIAEVNQKRNEISSKALSGGLDRNKSQSAL